MARRKTNSLAYGFEQYKIKGLNATVLKFNSVISEWYRREFEGGSFFSNLKTIYFCNKENQLSYLDNINDFSNAFPDNNGLIPNAKTLYIHPSCKLSRNLVFQKYKKTLNPWLADAVVIPELDLRDSHTFNEMAAFISERAQIIFLIDASSYYYPNNNIDFSKEEYIGKPLRQFLKVSSGDFCNIKDSLSYNVEDMLDAELMYYGKAYAINSNSALNDLIQNNIPKNRIVNEEAIMKSLGCEENKLSVEFLTSISEMLNSSDNDTVCSALKALSTMDYVHYPNSVILVLKESWYNYNYKKVLNSTAVKYMMTHLVGQRRRYMPVLKGKYITQQDYDVFKGLVHSMKIKSVDYLLEHECPFIYQDANLEYQPRIKN